MRPALLLELARSREESPPYARGRLGVEIRACLEELRFALERDDASVSPSHHKIGSANGGQVAGDVARPRGKPAQPSLTDVHPDTAVREVSAAELAEAIAAQHPRG